MTAQTESRDIALLFLYLRERERVPVLQEAGWIPWMYDGYGKYRSYRN